MITNRYRFVVALLLFVAGVINYMDRAALGIAAPLVQKDLGLSPSALGTVFSTFFLGYALFTFVGGQLADRFGPRRVYAWAAASWSLLCAATGLVGGFASLLVVRLLFGFAEGPMNSTTNRTITNWFPRAETSRAIGVTFSGQTIGSALAAPVVGLLALGYGWRIAFFVIGAFGLVWVLVWRHFASDRPQGNPRVGAAELRHIEAGRAEQPVPPADRDRPLRAFLLRPSTLALGLGMFAANYTFYIFLSWLPSYLTDALHIPLRQMAFVAAIPWACGFAGYILGGIVADFAYRRMADRLAARKLTTIAPLALGGVALLAVNAATGAGMAVTLIALAVMLLTGSVQSCWATIHELVPERRVGGVSGFIHLLSNISGIIGPGVTGLAVQYLGGYASVFLIGAAIAALGALAMAVFVRRPETAAPILAVGAP